MTDRHPGITLCILARDEAHQIREAIESGRGWTIQVIVIDNGSKDKTAEIARSCGALVLYAPPRKNFDGARNLAIEHAIGEFIFFLDADERIPAALGPVIREFVANHGAQFESAAFPYKNFFCGKWIQHCGWWPGYKAPPLVKVGSFSYNERLHAGVTVDGKQVTLRADNPDMAILHYSYNDLAHYLTKLNQYTDGEAENLYADRQSHQWQAMLAHFVNDWKAYYDGGQAYLDGMHGFVLAFMSGFYKFASRAKLWELRYRRGEMSAEEPVPSSVSEMLTLMVHVAQRGRSLLAAVYLHGQCREQISATAEASEDLDDRLSWLVLSARSSGNHCRTRPLRRLKRLPHGS